MLIDFNFPRQIKQIDQFKSGHLNFLMINQFQFSPMVFYINRQPCTSYTGSTSESP